MFCDEQKMWYKPIKCFSSPFFSPLLLVLMLWLSVKCKVVLYVYADMNLVPEMAMKFQDIPVIPCFALMIAFAEPLSVVRH